MVKMPRKGPSPVPPPRELADLCRSVLTANWRAGTRGETPYVYTAPSPGRYPWQWYWDSCFAAIAWRHFDRERARAELSSLLAAARPDGFIGHTSSGESRRTGCEGGSTTWGRALTS